MDMRPVRLYLLTALHDHLMRLGEARHIAKTAYLLIAQEIARCDLRPRQGWLLFYLTQRLEERVNSGDRLNRALSYVWVYDDIRGESFLDNAARVRKLILRATGDFAATSGPFNPDLRVQSSLLDTLKEVSDMLSSPILFSTDYDLLNFRIWFTGNEDDPDMHELWCHTVGSVDELLSLVKKYPSSKYLWRYEGEPLYPEEINSEILEMQTSWKNISILSLDKLYVMARERLCSEDDDRCELYTATH